MINSDFKSRTFLSKPSHTLPTSALGGCTQTPKLAGALDLSQPVSPPALMSLPMLPSPKLTSSKGFHALGTRFLNKAHYQAWQNEKWHKNKDKSISTCVTSSDWIHVPEEATWEFIFTNLDIAKVCSTLPVRSLKLGFNNRGKRQGEEGCSTEKLVLSGCLRHCLAEGGHLTPGREVSYQYSTEEWIADDENWGLKPVQSLPLTNMYLAEYSSSTLLNSKGLAKVLPTPEEDACWGPRAPVRWGLEQT